MRVIFHKGLLRTDTGEQVAVTWAEMDFGVIALVAGAKELIRELDIAQITVAEAVISLDLPGLDQEGIEMIAGSILSGGYLDMPGVEGKGEAVLFVMVNEAVHRLNQIVEEEEED
jgi:hypothetical protein